MKALATKFTVFGVLFCLQACAGTGDVYQDGDVVEPSDFKLITANVQKSGGLIQSGMMEYEGTGDLTEVYRAYVSEMRSLGWVSASDEINSGKAVGKLRKDNRTCELNFTASQGNIRISITVSQTK